MEVKEENKRQIASPDVDITTVQTEITDEGFKVTIEVGPGKMKNELYRIKKNNSGLIKIY